MRREAWLGMAGIACSVLLGVWVAPAGAGIVIGEVRLRGPNGASDEFVELFNASSSPVEIGGWKLKGSSPTGAVAVRAMIPAGTVLAPGCHYLFANSGGPYSGSVAPDLTYSLGVADDGGVALTLANDGIVDQVGMSAGAAFKEGAPLPALTTNQDRSYGRRPGGAEGHGVDTQDNASDFLLIAPSQPRNSLSACVAASDATATPTASPSPTSSNEPTRSVSPTSTPTMEPTAAPSRTPSASPTPSDTLTPTASPTETSSPVPTSTPTQRASETPTSSPTRTASRSPSATVTRTASRLPSPTSTPSPTPLVPSPGCGNGRLDPGEHCDGAHEDCPASCDFGAAGWLIRGNRLPAGANAHGCWAEWQVRTGLLERDSFGFPAMTQSCVDQDPACDANPEEGICAFQVRLCLDNVDVNLPLCRTKVTMVRVLAPRSDGSPHSDNRRALSNAIGALPSLAYANPTRCTAPFPVSVALDGYSLGREQLLLRVADAESGSPGHLSRLQLECRGARRRGR